ncbi:MAG TPA: Uma2 family endonuclease [Blastocatellia bacterium]|nr:Uma2 family endonuclease [Blastocatellia bacterium]
MALPQEKFIYTVEQYLEMERASEERREYVDGYVYNMAGESPNHSRINVNLLTILNLQLREKPCEAFSPNMKIRSGPFLKEQKTNKGMFSYADVSVVCGEPQFHDKFQDVLINPTVIIEILSESTEGFDRSEKFRRYRTHIPSLQDYVLVFQTLPWIQVYSRHSDGWLMTDALGLETSIRVPSIDCHLPLSDVYDRVEFPTLEEQAEETDAGPESD